MSEEQGEWDGQENPESPRRAMIEAPWVKMPLEMIRDRMWTRSHIAVYGELYWRAGQRGYFYEFQTKIGEQLGLSRDSVNVAITDLRENGYITTGSLGPQFGGVLRYLVLARIKQAPALNLAEASEEIHEAADNFRQLSIRPEKTPEKPPKKTAKPSVAASDEVVKGIWEYYRARIQPKARLRVSALNKIKRRLLGGYTADELTKAIDTFAGNEWWMEHNAHQGAEWFFDSDVRIERWLGLNNAPASKNGGGDHGGGRGVDGSAGAPRRATGLEQWSQ